VIVSNVDQDLSIPPNGLVKDAERSRFQIIDLGSGIWIHGFVVNYNSDIITGMEDKMIDLKLSIGK
jgi:hypothetical protein